VGSRSCIHGFMVSQPQNEIETFEDNWDLTVAIVSKPRSSHSPRDTNREPGCLILNAVSDLLKHRGSQELG
jgi:hypothetical protein